VRNPAPAFAFLFFACRGSPAPSEAERATPRPEAGASEAPAMPAAAPAPRLRACRVIKRTGHADGAAGEAAPALGELLPDAKVRLLQDEGLVVKSTVSGRELGLEGPLLAEVCPEGEEEVRLSWGSVRGFAGAGVRPGAEVWVATPLGVVRFNEANLKVEVAPAAERLKVTVTAGRAVFMPAKDAMGGPDTLGARLKGDAGVDELTIAAGVPFVLARAAAPVSLLARDLASSCARQADLVEEMARALLHADAGELGARAAQHVAARRQAWALCSSARAAAALDEPREGPLLADIEKAEQKWKQLTRSPVRR